MSVVFCLHACVSLCFAAPLCLSVLVCLHMFVCICVFISPCFLLCYHACKCNNVVVMVITEFQSTSSREAQERHFYGALRLCFMLSCLCACMFICMCVYVLVCVFVFVRVFRDLQKVYTRVSACTPVCVGSRLLLWLMIASKRLRTQPLPLTHQRGISVEEAVEGGCSHLYAP